MLLNPVILVMIVVIALGVFIALIVNQQQQRQRRLQAVITGRSELSGRGRDGKDKKIAQQRAELAKKLKEAGKEDRKEKKKREGSTRFLLQQAGFTETSVGRFYIYSLIFTVVIFLLLYLTSWSGLVKGLLLFTAFFGLPRLFLKMKAKRRQKKFLEAFADALDAIVRMIQAGMPVAEAVAMAGKEFDDPLGTEMSYIYDDQKLGIPLGEAAARASERMPLTEMKMFATAIQIQSETGSSLSEVLTNLSEVIRARFRLQRKIQALSSEAKASAAIIGCLPLVVMGGLYLVNPDYIMKLFTIPKGKLMVTGAAVWMGFGVIIMKQMINFKV